MTARAGGRLRAASRGVASAALFAALAAFRAEPARAAPIELGGMLPLDSTASARWVIPS